MACGGLHFFLQSTAILLSINDFILHDDIQVDCWSLGVLLYAMLYGTMPFTGHDFRTLCRQITNGLIHQPPVLSGLLIIILISFF